MYRSDRNYLFSEGDLAGVLDANKCRIRELVEAIPREQFLATSTDTLCEHIVAQLAVAPLVLHEDKMTMEHAETKIDVTHRFEYGGSLDGRPVMADGHLLKFYVPFSGDQAFSEKFKMSMPDEINSNHELVIVASDLDASTERIVRYLADEYGVRINAIFFRVFKDEGREYISRAWFRDPAEVTAGFGEEVSANEWNGEYYVSFGYPLDVVRDGLERGYIVAGGGSWYSKTLAMLEPGARIWVNVPGTGYIGVAQVEERMVPVDDFKIKNESGEEVLLINESEVAKTLQKAADDIEKADYLVRVRWIKKVDPKDAIREKGFFGNQNSVARPRAPRWNYTVERLKIRFGIND